MTVESKVIVTAEDRTRAAFAAIERNTGKTSAALTRLTSTALKLAGVGTLLVFFRKNAESTEKWRDEMARLDEMTNKLFNTAANAGQLDPLINAIKSITAEALGATIALSKLIEFPMAFSKDVKLLFTDFWQSGREVSAWVDSMNKAHAAQIEFKKELFKEAPRGFAKMREEEAERVKNAVKDLKKSEDERLKMILDHASAAEDAIRAESEISGEFSGAGLTRMGEGVVSEAQQKRDDLANEQAEKQRERLEKSVQDLSVSLMTEQQLEQMNYETKQQMLDDAFMQELISAEEHNRLLEQMEQDHQIKMGNVVAAAEQARATFEKMTAKEKTKFILGQVLDITNGVAANNKTMFQLNKAAGIANATINTYEGVTKALSAYPPPYSFVMAALQLAAGLAQIQQIKSTQFGSATSAPSIGGGGATPVFNAADTGVPALAAPTTSARPQVINVYLASDTGMVSTEWIREKLIPGLNESLGDGVTLNVMPA